MHKHQELWDGIIKYCSEGRDIEERNGEAESKQGEKRGKFALNYLKFKGTPSHDWKGHVMSGSADYSFRGGSCRLLKSKPPSKMM